MSTKKKIKRQKNIPLIYDEVKEKRTISITPSSWAWLKEQAKTRETSPSEIIETLIRNTKG